MRNTSSNTDTPDHSELAKHCRTANLVLVIASALIAIAALQIIQVTSGAPEVIVYRTNLEGINREVLRKELKQLRDLRRKLEVLANPDAPHTITIKSIPDEQPEPTLEELKSLYEKEVIKTSALFSSVWETISRQRSEAEKVDIQGFGSILVTRWGGLLLLALQTYFFLHLSALSRCSISQQDAVWKAPWFGLYRGHFAKTIFLLSTLGLPLLASSTIIVAMRFGGPWWNPSACIVLQVPLSIATFFAWRRLSNMAT